MVTAKNIPNEINCVETISSCWRLINISKKRHNMKSFSSFLSEATQSQAYQQSSKLGLKGDGHGGWLDRSGKVVARTDKGKLKFIDGRQAGAAEPAAAPRQAGPAPTPHNHKQHKHLHQFHNKHLEQHHKIKHKNKNSHH
jgi:hypothetical protein